MADFSITTLFVVPTAATLPTSGSTNNLTSGQFGMFLPDHSVATVANVGSAKYIYFAQGRNVYSVREATKKSDTIYLKNVEQWYKVTGSLQANTQITEISSLTAGCQEDISVTLRLDSMYIRAAYANSLTRTVMVTTPCCNCGSNPCDTLSASDIQATMQALAQAINDDVILNQFVTAGTQGSGATTKIIIQGQTLQVYGQGTSTDLTNYPYQFDRMFFWTYLMNGPVLTTDYEVQDYCNEVGTVSILQRASYPINTPAEIGQLEKDYWSYQAEYKTIFSNVNYNGEFQTYVDSAAAYDLYYITFKEQLEPGFKVGVNAQSESVIIALPQGGTATTGIASLLTAYFGTPDNSTATPSTTTTFTTSSTTTTSTTENVTP